MFTNSKPFFGLKIKKSSMRIFHLPICQPVSRSGLIATSKLERGINSLAAGAQVRPSEESSTAPSKNNIIENLASFCFPSNIFSWKIGGEKQKRLRFKKAIVNAEEYLKMGSHNWIRGLQQEPSTQKIVNTPEKSLSKLTLQSLFDNQTAIISTYIQHLLHSNHPILNYSKSMFKDPSEISSIQLRSIAVQLVARAIGFPIQIQSTSVEIQDDIEVRQRRLSEITELIYAAYLMHRTIVEIPEVQSSTESSESEPSRKITESEALSLHQGNKLATLMGDFLLAKSSKGLANLNNAKVTELMSDSIADISESEFISRTNCSKNLAESDCSSDKLIVSSHKSSQPFFSYDKWLQRTNLSIGSVLGHSCYCTMVFSGHEDPVRQLAFTLGSKIALVLQAYKDLSFFVKEDEELSSRSMPQYFDLLTLPVIFHIEENPSLVKDGKLDYAKIYEEVKTSQVAITRTRETLLAFQQSVLRLISQLPQNESSPAKKLLSELVVTLS